MKARTPRDAVREVVGSPVLPRGAGERFTGYGVIGQPFASGHYLAMRDLPATSYAPPHRSVWHRDPAGRWTFYSTNPGSQSCSRYFSSVTTREPVQCPIDVDWTSASSLTVRIPDVLHWEVELVATRATRLMSVVGDRLPQVVWESPRALAVLSRISGPLLRVGKVRMTGHAPNGQRFVVAPRELWSVTGSRAVLNGEELGPIGPLASQARLADFRPPQHGIFAVADGHFDTVGR